MRIDHDRQVVIGNWYSVEGLADEEVEVMSLCGRFHRIVRAPAVALEDARFDLRRDLEDEAASSVSSQKILDPDFQMHQDAAIDLAFEGKRVGMIQAREIVTRSKSIDEAGLVIGEAIRQMGPSSADPSIREPLEPGPSHLGRT